MRDHARGHEIFRDVVERLGSRATFVLIADRADLAAHDAKQASRAIRLEDARP